MNTPVRHNPLGALGADDDDDQAPAPQPQPRKPKLPKEEAERIAQQHGFAQGAPKEPAPAPAPAPRRGRRRITGRIHQINVKTTEAAIEKFYRIAEEMRAPLGEVLEQALEALEKARK
jgi:predicted TIM-barrel fold metal-dependent hydrolase